MNDSRQNSQRDDAVGLKDSTACPAFFIAPVMKPRTVCFCHAMVRMISARVAPFLRCSMAITWAVLLPWRGAVILGAAAWNPTPNQ